jgi:hypothetical protein
MQYCARKYESTVPKFPERFRIFSISSPISVRQNPDRYPFELTTPHTRTASQTSRAYAGFHPATNKNPLRNVWTNARSVASCNDTESHTHTQNLVRFYENVTARTSTPQGFAPRLLAFEELPGSWLDIVLSSAFRVADSPSHRRAWENGG